MHSFVFVRVLTSLYAFCYTVISKQEHKLKPCLIKNMEYEDTAFSKGLLDIIKEYKDGSEEPLDGDEVDILTEHLRNRLNLIEGNITQEDFKKLDNN